MNPYSQICDKFSQDFKRQVAEAFVASDESADRIGQRFGVCAATVVNWAARYLPDELAARRQRVGRNVQRRETPELVATLVELVRGGMSVNKASRQIGVAPNTCVEWLRKHGYESLIPPARRRHIPVEIRRQAAAEYLHGVPSAKVGAAYGVSATSVERWGLQRLSGEL